MNYLLLIIAIVLAVLRIAGVTHEAYQAAAHLFVGGLITHGFIGFRNEKFQSNGIKCSWVRDNKNALLSVWLAIGLSIVEVARALWFRFGASQ